MGIENNTAVKLANWLRGQKVKFCLRLKNNEFIQGEDEIWQPLDSLGLKPGISRFLPNIKMTKTEKSKVLT
jgi:hypothetical protein